MEFEFKLPDVGEGVIEGEIVSWLVQEGDPIAEDQPMVEVMTDKATVEIPSPVQGVVRRLNGAPGDIVEVGATLVVIETDQPVENLPGSQLVNDSGEQKSHRPGKRPEREESSVVLATPAIRRLARERNIDLSQVRGSGSGGRILAEDLQNIQSSRVDSPPESDGPSQNEIPYLALRRKIGQHLVEAKRQAPHFTFVEEADVTQLVGMKNRLDELAPSKTSITYLPFIIKAVVEGLKRYPILNASLDMDRNKIVLHRLFHIGIATSTPDGLLVPVLRNADKKSIPELAQELDRLSSAAREGRSQLEDLRGSTFSITSLGKLGGIMATPILNYPEVGILAVHRIVERPVVEAGQIVARMRMNLSLSLDHRVVDGAMGAEFLYHVISFIESPDSLLEG